MSPLRARGIDVDAALVTALAVPPVDSARNINYADVGGNKTDTHNGNSIEAFGHTLLEHTHDSAMVYPALAVSLQVVSSNVAHTLGVFKEIVAANQISEDFDIHWVAVQAASANGEYELVLYAATTEIGRCSFARTDKKDIDAVPFQCPIQPANTQIQAKLSTNNAVGDTCNIKIMYHLY